MDLKYLFTARFKDGSILQQNQADVSTIDPKRNSFYDVLHSPTPVVSIDYVEQKLWNPTKITVNYETGLFTINGVVIHPEPITIDDKEQVVTDRKPVRYMLTDQNLNATFDTASGKLLKTNTLSVDRTYFVGWETNIDGKTYKRILGLK